MLEDSQMAPFAEGLYFTSVSTSSFNHNIQLKPGINIIDNETGAEAARQRGVIIDLANWWSRKKRNNYYKDIIRRFPERTVIVSEGDSWFLHPQVYDIIDHLSKIYAIRCVAAATDTLANYFSDDKKFGAITISMFLMKQNRPSSSSAAAAMIYLAPSSGNSLLINPTTKVYAAAQTEKRS